ncbi:hypothetical protein K523DRAFT_323117 [Schizophyllum commune Tattone D]|nr:hypothetical protein K523DRAFT_323117 [Schizophyllum commune Tattone D]
MNWIISIGALGLVYDKYGAQYCALAALSYLLYRVADYIGLIAFLSESVQSYIWPPRDVAVISYRNRDSSRRGLIVLKRVDDDLNVTVIEVERGRGQPQCARCSRSDPQSSWHHEFCSRCGVCYCSQKCRKADARKHRHTCPPA